MKKKTYADLYSEYKKENYPDNSAIMTIYEYVTSRYQTAKRITKSVLQKELGAENFLKFQSTTFNPDLAWLVHRYAQLDGFEKDFVKFSVRVDDSETKRYRIRASSFMGMSDRDIATQVRNSLKNPDDANGYCTPAEHWGVNLSKEVLQEVLEALKS